MKSSPKVAGDCRKLIIQTAHSVIIANLIQFVHFMRILQLLSSIHIDPLESLVVQVASSSFRWLSRTSRAPRTISRREGREGGADVESSCCQSLKSLKLLDGLRSLRTSTQNACWLSYSAVVFGIGLQLTSVRLVI